MEYPIQRHLDCTRFKMKRNDKWYDLCFTDLTIDERNEVMNRSGEELLRDMCHIMAVYLRALGDEFDVVRE